MASMHWQSIILIRDNVQRLINNGVQYDQQTNGIINSGEIGELVLKNVQVFTFISSYPFYVSLHSNNISCGPCLKLS